MPKKQVNSLLSTNQTLISQTTANLLPLYIDNDIIIKSCELEEIHSNDYKMKFKALQCLINEMF